MTKVSAISNQSRDISVELGAGNSENNELLTEFSTLIQEISEEVIRQANFATALQEMKRLNEGFSSLQATLPKRIKEVEELGNFFTSARNEVRNLITQSVKNNEQHDMLLKQQIKDISSRYNSLADSLLENHKKALSGQTKQIQMNTDETIEQVHAAIVETQQKLEQKIHQLESELNAFSVQAKIDWTETSQKMEIFEVNVLQTITYHVNQQIQESRNNHRKLWWLMAGNVVLLIGALALLIAPKVLL